MRKINLQTLNCFKLLAGLLITFIVCVAAQLTNTIALWIGVACFIIGLIIGLIKYKNIGFYIFSISLGLILFSNSNNKPLITTNYTFNSQNVIIEGEVKSILNKKSDKQKIIVDGKFSSITIPTIYKTSILLTISGQIDKRIDIQIGDTILVDARIRPPREKVFEYDFDEVVYNKSIGTSWIGYANSNNVLITRNANWFNSAINSVYSNISTRIDSIFTDQTAAFIKAVVLGDRTGLTQEDRNKFSLVGVAHILSLSGLHIGIISAISLFVISIFRPNRWLKFVVFSIFVVLFVFLTGFQPPAIRSGVMAIFFMLGSVMFRETNMLNVSSMVLLGVIIFNPSLLYSVGFRMSLTAVLGIFLLYDNIRINITKNIY